MGQGFQRRKIAIVVLRNPRWRIVRLYPERIAATVNEARAGSYAELDIPFEK
jgi:hypothetical protein